MKMNIPGLGMVDSGGLAEILRSDDCLFHAQKNGVNAILTTGDKKVELIVFDDKTLAYVKSSQGYPAYYPVQPVQRDEAVGAVLMDLDGTTVKSEEFWIGIIEMTVRSLTGKPGLELEQADIPFVSGHSVSEHLQYCIDKYCAEASLVKAREIYYEHTHREMHAILHEGKQGAFTPAEGVRDWLLMLKRRGIKIGLVTSGLYEKAYPEILSAFRAMRMGEPEKFYDVMITAGNALGRGQAGTLGELEAKPHPWLYAEAAAVGLGIGLGERGRVIGIEDSGAGVCSVRLAGFFTVGIAGGNISQSGTRAFCSSYCNGFEQIEQEIF